MSRDRFYITTAIDYANDNPHIGHAYEKIGADVLARFNRLAGRDVHFLMGNDEHSQNVEKAARKQGLDPHVFCKRMARNFEDTWRRLDISHNDFIRTTEERHEKAVEKFFGVLLDKDRIYKSRYEGWYCVSCEAYLQEKELEDGNCPVHGIKPDWLAEDNYFFRLSEYRDKLLEHIRVHPEFIVPDYRRNEVVSFLEGEVRDISVSRQMKNWGVPLPVDKSQVVYVWFDALINYISALGYAEDDDSAFREWWPADVQVIGKDILRFHCVIWPAMLMAAGLPLPRTVLAHGFVQSGGKKMSKTTGVRIDPLDLVEKVGPDPLRYHLMKEGGFGRDSDITLERFFQRYNSELADELGNLLNRLMTLVGKYREGRIPAPKGEACSIDDELETLRDRLRPDLEKALGIRAEGDADFHDAIESIWTLVRRSNKYVEETAPWKLRKEEQEDRLSTVLFHLAAALKDIALSLYPFMPGSAARMWGQLGLGGEEEMVSAGLGGLGSGGVQVAGVGIGGKEQLFPRYVHEVEPESGPGAEPGGKVPDEPSSEVDSAAAHGARKDQVEVVEEPEEQKEEQMEMITFSDFTKLDLRTAVVKTAERVEKADRLLKLEVDIGGEIRQVVAGIAARYAPEDLVGKKIVVLTNLAPAKIRGVESNGMLLAAVDGDEIGLVTVDGDISPGASVS